MSIKTGFKPNCTKGQSDVDQHRTGIITSSPFFNLFFLNGLPAAKIAKRYAEDPQFTIKACLTPISLANVSSNFLV